MDQGVAIVQEPCDNSRAQDWGFVTLGGNRYRLLNHKSGLCIDAPGDAVDGTPIVQWPCATISNQTWDTGQTIPHIVPLTARTARPNPPPDRHIGDGRVDTRPNRARVRRLAAQRLTLAHERIRELDDENRQLRNQIGLLHGQLSANRIAGTGSAGDF